MSELIKRSFDVEMRALDQEETSNDMIVEGYAIKFNETIFYGSKSWGWYEKINRNALATADLADVVFNLNHNNSDILARTINQSLELIIDEIGLKIRSKIVDTTLGRDVYALIKAGLISKMSFTAIVKKSNWTESDDEEYDTREIMEFGKFYDVSAVTFPAYQSTELNVSRDSFKNVDSDAKKHFEEKEYRSQIKELDKLMEDIYD